MTKIKTVFLDMDQVLTDFNKAICEKFGLPYPPQIYDFFESIRSEVNDICTIDFWVYLEWMQDGHEILREVIKKFNTVYILTSTMPNPESFTGKIIWMHKHLPAYSNYTIPIPFGVPKSLFARPNTLLIDDRDKTIEEFRDAKGNAILVPRPWNKLYKYSDVSSSIVRKELEKYETIRC